MILGVSADAEMQEIKKVAQRSLMELRLGGDEDPAAIRRIENAQETLQDPVKRFRWGLFWPELTPSEAESFRANPVLSTLAYDQNQDAAAAYELISECNSVEMGLHNLGVLALLHAVVATEEAQKGTPDDIRDDLECVRIWHEAFRNLELVIESDEFWMRQKLRAKALGDARLNGTHLAEIRAGFLGEILTPLARVITTALLDGHTKVAKTYVDLLRTSGFQEEIIEETLSSVYKPLADRVERNINLLSEKLVDLAERSDDELPYRKVLDAFKKDSMHDLNVMLAVGDLPGYAEEHARDTAAEFLRSLAMASWNTAGKTNVSKEAIQLALGYADADSLKSTYREDISALQRIDQETADLENLIPLKEELQKALANNRLKTALSLIDKLILATSGDAEDNLMELRTRLSSNIALQLYTRALERANSRDYEGAHKLLDEAMKYATVKQEGKIILEAMTGIPQPSSGCLLFLLALLGVGLLAGAVGGALYANII